MPPKAKARKPKKPVQQKQKQRQSQRVVVNINQAKAKGRRRASKPRQAQQLAPQVSVQPQIIMTGGSALPTYVNPAPIQSSGGFNPPPPTPSLGAPLEVPVFAGEPARAIGDEEVRVPVTSPITTITPVRVEEPPIIQQPTPAPAQPPVLISSAPSKSDRQFISKPSSMSSIASLFSDISKETGITSQSIADTLFKKKKTPPPPPPSIASQEPQILTLMNPNPSVGSSEFPSTASSVVASQAGFNIPDDNSLSSIVSSSRSSDLSSPYAPSLDLSAIDRKLNPPKKPEPKPLNKARKFIKDEMSVEGGPKSFETISTRSGFYNEPHKGSFTNKEIIVPPKEVVVLKKPESKRIVTDPYDVFSSDSDLTMMTSPMKKRPVTVSSDSDAPGGRRIPTISEKPKEEPKINSKTKLADLQAVAEGRDIPIRWPDGKKKNRETLLGEIRVDQKYPKGF